MDLIKQLIDDLTANSSNIETVLTKAQVLAHRLGDAEMTAWVEWELGGYPNVDSTPEYRRQHLTITGVITNGYYRYNDANIELGSLKPETREKISTRVVTEGVGAIQHRAIKEASGERFAVRFDAATCRAFSKPYRESGYWVETAFGHTPAGSTQQILTQVRTRLLKFALLLQDRVPADAKEDAIQALIGGTVVKDLLNQTVFGDNTTIVIGQGNSLQNLHNSVTRNDLASLIRELEQKGLPREATADLVAAIAKDKKSPEHDDKRFGKNVSEWCGKTLKAVVESTVSTVTEAAVKGAISGFYGF